MKTTLETVKEKLEGEPKEVEKGKGYALVLLIKEVGRVASNLELIATCLQSLVVEVGKHK